ncbi:cytochrome P450 [Gloeophyllum trabeum ATCC 11539]|uniref:Cytochrome P450 n=1 Tax=Gloeophyllum trabeum (strain ATCC 11539 / FP-39264 / Madison 617) TaxID=670483 RepID=S7QDZ0_GLOTA|nr:cytochrome P450 [Gloeophyllum trabeum ATCC 11539]EPQ57508.1 cytochrome P450 [Gloeophyllum trabeum ATCC 11539]
MMPLLNLILFAALVLTSFAVYYVFVAPRFNPLQELPGPPVKSLFDNHMAALLNPDKSPINHQRIVEHYGRLVRIRGLGPWDERILPLDPVSLAHVLKNTAIYEKPWQSRQLITGLIGCGMLAAEGQMHKRQRRVATPAFSIQNMRALIPLVFGKGNELKDKWLALIYEGSTPGKEGGMVLDVCSWVSRATFDVIGLAGFDYEFNAIQDESNELFLAYKEMFEIAISQSAGGALRSVLAIYFPIIDKLFPNQATRTVDRAHDVIERVAGQLIQEKKRKIHEGEVNGKGYHGKDLLALLLKSNVAADLPPEQRISDEDILHNINTFMFAGSDTTSLALTWILALLAQHPQVQTRLRNELLCIAPSSDLAKLTPEETESFYTTISNLPYLHNVVRETLRLIPPVHSSLRVATQDDIIPVSYPVRMRDGREERSGLRIPKGTFVHVPIEAFQLDKEWWGEDAWSFNPDRWDNLPEIVTELPGLFSNLLTFSAGPRSCIGMRFSMIEMKTFLYILLTNFVFSGTGDKIIRANVVLTRPYVQGRYKEGSQCPLFVRPYTPGEP